MIHPFALRMRRIAISGRREFTDMVGATPRIDQGSPGFAGGERIRVWPRVLRVAVAADTRRDTAFPRPGIRTLRRDDGVRWRQPRNLILRWPASKTGYQLEHIATRCHGYQARLYPTAGRGLRRWSPADPARGSPPRRLAHLYAARHLRGDGHYDLLGVTRP